LNRILIKHQFYYDSLRDILKRYATGEVEGLNDEVSVAISRVRSY
jgi:hypothetical protein